MFLFRWLHDFAYNAILPPDKFNPSDTWSVSVLHDIQLQFVGLVFIRDIELNHKIRKII